MSKYTTEVRFICETSAGLSESKGFNDVNQIITTAAPLVFNFDFPIFDEAYRLPLEVKILRHFYTREISEETVGLWKLRLQDKLCTIMPYYNKLYESELIQFNPMNDVDLTTEHEGSGTGTHSDAENVTANTSTTGTDGNVRWDLFSDTPQGGINGITADEDSVANNTYLTDARKITDSGTRNETVQGTSGTNRSGLFNNSDEYTESIVGKRGSKNYSEMLLDFRKTFLNIDEMILRDLEPLFFGLWM